MNSEPTMQKRVTEEIFSLISKKYEMAEWVRYPKKLFWRKNVINKAFTLKWTGSE